ncbi:MAG: 7TM diverse intracellular signaling domain-containing protein [Saprospiraceae bacterium]|nr:7TM diverse intracellular signaling domain-containing protein [Saprospiraceae bacterium]
MAGLFILAFFCFRAAPVICQDTIFLRQPDFERILLDSSNAVQLEDPGGKLRYPAVKQIPFPPLRTGSNIPDFRNTIRQFWTRALLKNTGADTLQVYLMNEMHDDLQLFAEMSDGTLVTQTAGTNTPYHQWPLKRNKYTFTLTLPPGITADCWIRTGFIYVSSDYITTLVLSPDSLAEAVSRQEGRFNQHRWMGISFLAITFFLLLFTIFQYFQVKERMYLYYSGYLAATFFYFLRKMETYPFFSSPLSEFPPLIDYPETASAMLVHILYFLFVKEFLDIPQKDRLLNKVLNALTIGCLVYILGDAVVMAFTGTMAYTVVPYMQFRMLLLIPMIYALVLIAGRHYQPLGKYVMWGSVLLLVGSVLTLLISLVPSFGELLPAGDRFVFTYAGTLLECLLFSLGLGYKGRLVLEERNRLQNELVHQLEENRQIELAAREKMEIELASRTEEIHRKNKELESLKMEQTRMRIARDLHDEMGSTLSSISIMAESAKRKLTEDADRTQLDFIGVKTREVMDSMSDIVWSVNPENDRFEQVVVRMEELTTTLMVAREIPFHFEAPTSDEMAHVDIPMEKRKDFYLIFKEALNNAVKYAQASRVEVKIEVPEGKVLLTVRDNGVGFNINNVQPGLGGNGLRNMFNRANNIQADLNIESEPGNGTTVRLEMPLH